MSAPTAGQRKPDGQQPPFIAFNRPSLQGREIELMQAAVAQGQISADGPFSAQTSDLLRHELGACDVLLTTSCTAALEMSALLLDLQPGDTIVVPSFGFVTTALAFARQGARILFCDIEETTLGLDPKHLDALMDDSVRAVVPIHYAGVACELDEIKAVLDRWPRAELIEDNAHGLFGTYRGKSLGTFGRFATLSFHETKNFTCGEGGALILNDARDVDRAHIVLQKGTNRRAFAHGQVDKYSWVDVGSSFGLADVLAAFLFGQLEHRGAILAKRRQLFELYRGLLAPGADAGRYRLAEVPTDRGSGYHMFYVLLSDYDARNRVLTTMQRNGVHATFHYVPLHSSEGGRRFAARETACPVTAAISERLLRLPFYTDMSDETAHRVVEVFLDALRSQ